MTEEHLVKEDSAKEESAEPAEGASHAQQ